MTDHKLLRVPQRKLALSYGVMMGLMYFFIGAYSYYSTSQHHYKTVEQEISFIANTVHNNLEPKLIAPDRIDPSISEVFPDFCIVPTCTVDSTSQRHFTSAFASAERYYLILVNSTGVVKATAGLAANNTNKNFTKDAIKSAASSTMNDENRHFGQDTQNDSSWSTWHNLDGKHYRQFAFIAHGQSSQQTYVDWGRIYIGRDISDVDSTLQAIQVGLVVSFPLALIVISGLSWYLAGRAMLPLYVAYEQQQLFTASVAHELRTPLAINQLKIEQQATQLSAQNPAIASALADLRGQNMRLNDIVNDLLLLTQLDRSRLENDLSFCNLDEVLLDITEEFSALYSDYHIATTIPAHPVKIRGSQDRIARLVSNLLDNAIKYTPAGGDIQILIAATPRHYLLKVQDTGIGMNPTELAHIFDRFYRIDKDRNRSTGGIGLGLTLVRSIAQLYGARVWVESQIGKGTTFTVAFPVKSSRKSPKS